jgi:hypothetical protein
MSYGVRFTPEAAQDLLELYDFLAIHDVRAAQRALVAIRKARSASRNEAAHRLFRRLGWRDTMVELTRER